MQKPFIAACGMIACLCTQIACAQPAASLPNLMPLSDEGSRAELFKRVEAAATASDPSAAQDNSQIFNLYGPFAFPTDALFDLAKGSKRTNSIFGIDISHYTPSNFPIESLRSKQVSFLYMKASQGSKYVDSSFSGFWDRAGNLSGNQRIHRGAYHFLSSSATGESQAATFLSVLSKKHGLRDTDMPPVVDLEWDVSAGHPDDAWKQVETDVMLKSLRTFLNIVQKQTHRVPVIYTARAFLVERFGSPSAADSAFAEFAKTYPIWIADYSRTSRASEKPNGFASPLKSIWQFTASATMAIGFGARNFDASIFKGSDAEFLADLGVKDFS